MKEKCCFEKGGNGDKCSILLGTKQCGGCKFFKTAEQFQKDYERARRILEAKGLESCMTADGKITTRRRR